jgi:hypothetical protein
LDICSSLLGTIRHLDGSVDEETSSVQNRLDERKRKWARGPVARESKGTVRIRQLQPQRICATAAASRQKEQKLARNVDQEHPSTFKGSTAAYGEVEESSHLQAPVGTGWAF